MHVGFMRIVRQRPFEHQESAVLMYNRVNFGGLMHAKFQFRILLVLFVDLTEGSRTFRAIFVSKMLRLYWANQF